MYVLQNGYTALHIAAKKNELEIGQLLLDQKADAGALSKVCSFVWRLHFLQSICSITFR